MGLEKGEEKGPTWADVSLLIEHLEALHRCQVRIEMGRKRVGKAGLVADVTALRARGRNDWTPVCYVTRYWPTHQARTMPGLLVQALWALSESVTEYDDLPLFRAFPEEELPPPPAA